LLTDTDLSSDVRDRAASLDHQAGSLLPKLGGIDPTADDNLPRSVDVCAEGVDASGSGA
jgi:hypothetical protein